MTGPLRLAYLTPLPPARTGIADYSVELLPHLAQLAEVVVYSEQFDHACPELAALDARPLSEYSARRWEHDLPVYQIGNSRYHAGLAEMLLRYPGVMVLHDFGLHQLCVSRSLDAGRPVVYTREMGYALGPAGVAQSERVLAWEEAPPHFGVPLNDRFLATSLGVLTHSRYAERLVLERAPSALSAVVPAPIRADEAPSLRARLDLPADACVFASFGLVSQSKQLEAALVAFAEVRQEHPTAIYVVVGEWRPDDVDVVALVARLGLEGTVRFTGFVPTREDFLGWLAAVDVVVNLRYPTVGETSAVALRALAAGRALVVYDHGWYAELPSDACVKLPPLDEAALVRGMTTLARDPELRAELGARGQAYARASHSPAAAARAYVAFAQVVLARAGERFR